MLAADVVRPGGMTRCRALRTQAGGKGANVVRALRALGDGRVAAGAAGGGGMAAGGGGGPLLAGFAAGRGGRLIAELAHEEGLELDLVVTGGEARVSTVVLGDDGSVTRLYELGPKIEPDDELALTAHVAAHPAVTGDWAVVTGAAPPGVSPGFYAALVRAARAAGYRVLVDATEEQLSGALAERPDLVKVNLPEACSAVGRPEARCEDERRATPAELVAEGLGLCRQLVTAGAAGAVVTLGAAGATAVLDGDPRHVSTPPIRVVSPVGSGDCFAAGLALALSAGEPGEAALRLAAGAAAANATSPYNGDVDPALARRLAAEAVVALH